MKKIILPLLFLLAVSSSFAQKKIFTYDQLFKSGYPDITHSLPDIRGWLDDDHYLEMQNDSKVSGKQNLVVVEAKTGYSIPYLKSSEEQSLFSPSSLGLTEDVKNLSLSPDGKWVAYTKKNNLFAMKLASRQGKQLTRDGSDTILNGYASWVYYEEILGRASHYRAFWWSPDSKHIAFMRFDDSPVPVYPIYVSEGQHGFLENQRYPKAGDKNPRVNLGIASLENDSITWADIDQKADQYFGMPMWTPTGKFWVQWMNRGQDKLKIYNIDLHNGTKQEIYSEQQDTWIDLDEEDRIYFLSNGKEFILKSDKDGWDNLYLYDTAGKLLNRITSGNFWETSILQVDEKTHTIFIKARRDNSARFDLYKVGVNGKGLTRVTFGEYSHDRLFVSPGGKYFISTYSNLSSPPKMVLADNNGKIIRELGNGMGTEFRDYALPALEFVRVKSGDGLFELPLTITYPINFDPKKRYPVLITVYGGPNAGSVYDRWQAPTGIKQWWAQEGVIQVSMDNRSSGHFGKKGMNFIHRQLGKWEIEDYMACGKWLRSKQWIDTSKIAITGGSFGGYITCMALTYGAAVFNYGIANSSVTDWHLYDTHYTERYMDAPDENPEGYKNTSVLTYVNQYKGLLRITHGTSDDNVHMQNSIQLISKLEDLNRHFELMLYPNQRHGVTGAKEMYMKTETYQFIYQHLLEKPMPEQFRMSSPNLKGF